MNFEHWCLMEPPSLKEVISSLEMCGCEFVMTSPDCTNIYYEVHPWTEIGGDLYFLLDSLFLQDYYICLFYKVTFPKLYCLIVVVLKDFATATVCEKLYILEKKL